MPLNLELKPGERILLGEYDLTTTERTRLIFHSENVAILRQKDILPPELANTPAERLYLSVQCMYLSKDPRSYRDTYESLRRAIVQKDPVVGPYLENIDKHVRSGDMFKALRETKKLVEREKF
jgi:flagellar protein FlbT